MSVNFGQLKTQIGQRVGDTSTTFATIIGYYINQRYRELLRRTNWNSIVPDYTITAASGASVTAASTYTLPVDFGKELYVFNDTTNKDIPHTTMEQLVIDNPTTLDDVGSIDAYTIFTTKNTSATSAEASAARVNKVRFWRAPGSDNVMRILYIMRAPDLSGSTDELVLDCETAVEYGATADAWTYKRQFAKATHFEKLFEQAIQNLMWDKDYSPNRIPMMAVTPLDRSEGI